VRGMVDHSQPRDYRGDTSLQLGLRGREDEIDTGRAVCLLTGVRLRWPALGAIGHFPMIRAGSGNYCSPCSGSSRRNEIGFTVRYVDEIVRSAATYSMT